MEGTVEAGLHRTISVEMSVFQSYMKLKELGFLITFLHTFTSLLTPARQFSKPYNTTVHFRSFTVALYDLEGVYTFLLKMFQ